jgi:hypothetical protein
MESFSEFYFQCLQHEFKDQEQMAQPFATVVIAYLFAWFGCIYSSDVVAENNFTFLNHFMGVYDSF